MRGLQRESVCVVIVVEDKVPALDLLGQIREILESYYSTVDVLIIANGVTRAVGEQLRKQIEQVPDGTLTFIPTRVDYHLARLIGIDNALGDWVLLLGPSRAELAIIPELVSAARKGRDAVIAIPEYEGSKKASIQGFLEKIFIRMCKVLTGVEIEPARVSPRLLSRSTCIRILGDPHGELLVRARHIDSGFSVGLIRAKYDPHEVRPPRDVREAIRLGLAVLSRSGSLPLRLASLGALGFAIFSSAYSLYVFGIYLFKDDIAPGWTTLSLQLSLAFIFMSLGFWLLVEQILAIRASLPPKRRVVLGREIRSPLSASRRNLNVVDPQGRLYELGGGNVPAREAPREIGPQAPSARSGQ